MDESSSYINCNFALHTRLTAEQPSDNMKIL